MNPVNSKPVFRWHRAILILLDYHALDEVDLVKALPHLAER